MRSPALNKVSALILLATVLLLSLIALATIHFTESPPNNSTYRTNILAPDKTRFSTSFGGNLALSPDGNSLAFIALDSLGISHLWVRPLNALEARVFNGTDNSFLPFWSPDSRFIGFFADGKLKKIAVAGGPAQTLCDADAGRGGTWNEDGTIIFSPGVFTPLSYVSSAGGRARPLTKLDTSRRDVSHRWPIFLPDGKHYLYANIGDPAIVLASIDSTVAPRVVVPHNSNVEYADGHLIYIREGVLTAQPFNPNTLQTSGEAFALAESPYFDVTVRRGAFSASQNGSIVYQTGETSTSGVKLVWRDRSGKQLGAISHSVPGYLNFRISPDGSRIAISQVANNNNLNNPRDNWIYEIDRDVWTRFTFDAAEDKSPVWSPDGKTIVFQSERSNNIPGVGDLFRKEASGAGIEELLLTSNQNKLPTDWSRDGKFILYHAVVIPLNHDIWVLPITTAGQLKDEKPFTFLQTDFDESFATFSPDGRWIAYQSNESGKEEIYIRPFPGPGGKWQVSKTGGAKPHWRGNGQELFFISPDLKIMSAEIKLGTSTPEIGSVKSLFSLPFIPSGYLRNPSSDIFQVTPDGQRFLIESFPESQNASVVTLVVNWPGEIKQK